MVSIEGEYDYITEMQSSFTTGDTLISDVQSEVLAPTLEYLIKSSFHTMISVEHQQNTVGTLLSLVYHQQSKSRIHLSLSK